MPNEFISYQADKDWSLLVTNKTLYVMEADRKPGLKKSAKDEHMLNLPTFAQRHDLAIKNKSEFVDEKFRGVRESGTINSIHIK
jgi:hypothetical protein